MRTRYAADLFATVERVGEPPRQPEVERVDPPPAPRGQDAWTRRRLPVSSLENTLHLATRMWLVRLPRNHMPTRLAQFYPRVANRLARLWNSPPACIDYFDDLRIDRRGGRRGFPREVQQEIAALYGHYRDRYLTYLRHRDEPPSATIWENEPDRERRRPDPPRPSWWRR
ncbi:MAG TPA: hypothetical protein VMU33_01370 [Burkholderiaceae bacterium]|nr:hypothetical protein [Burkholderiaceae bacterium]